MPPPPLRVAVVAHHPETLDGLLAYLRQSGCIPFGFRSLERFVPPPSVRALVLFPDDFEPPCIRAVADDFSHRAGARLILISQKPWPFKHAGGRGCSLVILPKPSFGWTILDAIRAPSQGSP